MFTLILIASLTIFSVHGFCPAGYYCSKGLQQSCPPGYYCPAGSYRALNCLPGTYNQQYGLESVSDCLSCPPGYYCGAGANRPGGFCAEGYYCSSGSSDPRPSDGRSGNPCPEGYYCPQGSSAPLPCPDGAYCPKMTGYPTYCRPGYYCPSGTASPVACPVGTFLNDVGSTSIDNCTECTAGHACTRPGLLNPNVVCLAGYYCLQGATTNSPRNGIHGSLCRPGFYCPMGSSTQRQCPDGTFSNHAGGYVCHACPQGQTCTGGMHLG